MSGPERAGPEFPPAQAARWAKEDGFSMRYGATALLLGWLITFVLFCLGLAAVFAVSPRESGLGWYFLPVALIYGFPVAAILGLPLAIKIAWPLQRVRNQQVHILVFALTLGAVMAAVILIPSGGEMGWAVAGLIGWTAVCGAVGRASVMKMVSRRNATPSLCEESGCDRRIR